MQKGCGSVDRLSLLLFERNDKSLKSFLSLLLSYALTLICFVIVLVLL